MSDIATTSKSTAPMARVPRIIIGIATNLQDLPSFLASRRRILSREYRYARPAPIATEITNQEYRSGAFAESAQSGNAIAAASKQIMSSVRIDIVNRRNRIFPPVPMRLKSSMGVYYVEAGIETIQAVPQPGVTVSRRGQLNT